MVIKGYAQMVQGSPDVSSFRHYFRDEAGICYLYKIMLDIRGISRKPMKFKIIPLISDHMFAAQPGHPEFLIILVDRR
jgi:hypothetical protein